MKKTFFILFSLIFSAPLAARKDEFMHKKPSILRFEDNYWASLKIIHHPTSEMMLSKNTYSLNPVEANQLSSLFDRVSTRKQSAALNIDFVNKLISFIEQAIPGNIKLIFENSTQPPIFIKISKHTRPSSASQKTSRFKKNPSIIVFEIFSAQKMPPTFIVNLLESIAVQDLSPAIFFKLLGATVGISTGLFAYYCRSKKAQNSFDFLYHQNNYYMAHIARQIGPRVAFYAETALENCLYKDLVTPVEPIPHAKPLSWIAPTPVPEILPNIELCCFNAPFPETITSLCSQVSSTATPNLKEIVLIVPPMAVTPQYLTALSALKEIFNKKITLLMIASSGFEQECVHLAQLTSSPPPVFSEISWTAVQKIERYTQAPLIQIKTSQDTSPAWLEVAHEKKYPTLQVELAELAARYSSIKKTTNDEFCERCLKLYNQYTQDSNRFPDGSNILIYDENTKNLWTSGDTSMPVSVAIILSNADDAKEHWDQQTTLTKQHPDRPDETYIFKDGCLIHVLKTDNILARLIPEDTADACSFLQESMNVANQIARSNKPYYGKASHVIESFYNSAELICPLIAKLLKIPQKKSFGHAYFERKQGIAKTDYFALVKDALCTWLNKDLKDESIAFPLSPDITTQIPESTQLMCFSASHKESRNFVLSQLSTTNATNISHLVFVTNRTEFITKECQAFIAKLPKKEGLQVHVVIVQETSTDEKENSLTTIHEDVINKCKELLTPQNIAWCIGTKYLNKHLLPSYNNISLLTESSHGRKHNEEIGLQIYNWAQTNLLIFNLANHGFAPNITTETIKKNLARIDRQGSPLTTEGLTLLNNILLYDENTNRLYIQDDTRPISHALLFRRSPLEGPSKFFCDKTTGRIRINKQDYFAHYIFETTERPLFLCKNECKTVLSTTITQINKQDIIQSEQSVSSDKKWNRIFRTQKESNIRTFYTACSLNWFKKARRKSTSTDENPATTLAQDSPDCRYLKKWFPTFFADYTEFDDLDVFIQKLKEENSQTSQEITTTDGVTIRETIPQLVFIEADSKYISSIIERLNSSRLSQYIKSSRIIFVQSQVHTELRKQSLIDRFDKEIFQFFRFKVPIYRPIFMKENDEKEIFIAELLYSSQYQNGTTIGLSQEAIRGYISHGHYQRKKYFKLNLTSKPRTLTGTATTTASPKAASSRADLAVTTHRRPRPTTLRYSRDAVNSDAINKLSEYTPLTIGYQTLPSGENQMILKDATTDEKLSDTEILELRSNKAVISVFCEISNQTNIDISNSLKKLLRKDFPEKRIPFFFYNNYLVEATLADIPDDEDYQPPTSQDPDDFDISTITTQGLQLFSAEDFLRHSDSYPALQRFFIQHIQQETPHAPAKKLYIIST
ncbi:hypothetical protein FJ366_02645 [Candidatus Dependentiae bacterium]|nr:hypothetical protein [Candidatus Dependentiae bacterium]